jgi:hypothetical protein
MVYALLVLAVAVNMTRRRYRGARKERIVREGVIEEGGCEEIITAFVLA